MHWYSWWHKQWGDVKALLIATRVTFWFAFLIARGKWEHMKSMNVHKVWGDIKVLLIATREKLLCTPGVS